MKRAFLSKILMFSMLVAGANLPSIDSELIIKNWQVAGPFLISKGEQGINDLMSLTSPIADNGLVHWFSVSAANANVQIHYPDTNWELAAYRYGQVALYNVGFASAQLPLPQPKRALVHLSNVSSFSINGVNYPGYPYPDDFVMIPVILDKGINRILLKLVGKGDKDFFFRLLPSTADVIFLSDYTVPDLLEGERFEDAPFSVSLANTTGLNLKGLTLKIKGNAYFYEKEFSFGNIISGAIVKPPLKFSMKEPAQAGKEYFLELEVYYQGKLLNKHNVPLEVKKGAEVRRRTFLSKMDNSVQYYAILYPLDNDDSLYKEQGGKGYALILSLHGAGEEAIAHVKNYRAKEWAFVVGPTNRRPYGFDWQDQGRIDFEEVFEHIKTSYNIDEDRVYLMGASMGGQGVWHIALQNPSPFAAIVPHAAWTTKAQYTPEIFNRSTYYTSPEVLALRQRALFYANTPFYAFNAMHLPVLISHGALDRVVPALHSRIYYKLLSGYGYDVNYRENPTGEHVWGVAAENSSFCLDEPAIMDFLKYKKRITHPTHVRFKTFDISVNNKYYWIEVVTQEKVFHETMVDATVLENYVQIESTNVETLKVELQKGLLDDNFGALNWNGTVYELNLNEKRTFTFSKNKNTQNPTKPIKSKDQYGVLPTVFFSPFAIVYGTQGGGNVTDILLNNARTVSYLQWSMANGYTLILPDTDLDDNIIKNYNLVLLGSPKVNLVSRKIMPSLPVQIENNSISIGDKILYGNYALNMIYPNPLNSSKYVAIFAGTDEETEKISLKYLSLADKSGAGDFIIFTKEIEIQGWGAVKGLGFFSNQWELSNNDYVVIPN
ncbi:MAG: prolyl oligopeptidase family serine peptidase [Candidatus Magnetoovum sp. WYHC-5]|nr:prolyl oligopeptidase family serine peptidase [Candidatus Magnetoovum sp. WYHC-5]